MGHVALAQNLKLKHISITIPSLKAQGLLLLIFSTMFQAFFLGGFCFDTLSWTCSPSVCKCRNKTQNETQNRVGRICAEGLSKLSIVTSLWNKSSLQPMDGFDLPTLWIKNHQTPNPQCSCTSSRCCCWGWTKKERKKKKLWSNTLHLILPMCRQQQVLAIWPPFVTISWQDAASLLSLLHFKDPGAQHTADGQARRLLRCK